MKRLLLIFAFLSMPAFGQTTLYRSVQPFVAGGLELNGSGYTPAGAAGVSGIFLDSKYLLLDPEVGYYTGGKNDDNANTSAAGHTRYMKGDVLIKIGEWYVGPGCSWSKLYTPAYDKSSVHPRFAFGRQWPNDGYRLTVEYVQRGTDKANGIHGFDVVGYKFFGRYAFLRMDLGGYWGHNTTPPSGPTAPGVVLTSEFQTVVGFRF